MAHNNMSLGLKLIIGFHILNLVLWFFGQTWAVIDYDAVASWGLQDPRALLNPAIVEVNRGIGLADTFILLPIFLLATIGLLRKKFWGAVFSWMAFAITLYWPTVFWCSQFFFASNGITHYPTAISAIILPAIFMGFSIWGSWYLYREHVTNQR